MDQAQRLKDLEKENARLNRLLADAELDKAILREAATASPAPASRRASSTDAPRPQWTAYSSSASRPSSKRNSSFTTARAAAASPLRPCRM